MKMAEKIDKFNAGELMTTSTGEYSDYQVNGIFRALKSFDAQALLVKWAESTGREINNGIVRSNRINKNIEFLGWLNKSGYVEDIEYRELHIGSYGDTELS